MMRQKKPFVVAVVFVAVLKTAHAFNVQAHYEEQVLHTHIVIHTNYWLCKMLLPRRTKKNALNMNSESKYHCIILKFDRK